MPSGHLLRPASLNRLGSRGSLRHLLAAMLTALLLVDLAGSVTARAETTKCYPEIDFDPKSPEFLSGDTNQITNTQEFNNCYAWQMFVAMNWPVDRSWPANKDMAGEPDRNATVATWGVPPDPKAPMPTATVWQSFKPAQDIFLPNARKPSGWGVLDPMPPSCKGLSGEKTAGARWNKRLQFTSKLPLIRSLRAHVSTQTVITHPDAIMEAFGGWLTDQNKQLVWYEILTNRAEFTYIDRYGLYDAANQHVAATNANKKHPHGLVLPQGKKPSNGATQPQPWNELGAFEIKAAWRILTGLEEQFARYLTTAAWLEDPETGECTEEVVGLVGLHIIHATETFPDFIWATFEQVDNVPGNAGEKEPPWGYSFNNPKCDAAQCPPNKARVKCDEENHCEPLFPMDEPVQVTRASPTPAPLAKLNKAVQELIAEKAGSRSVFQYYKLVNVLWDQAPGRSTPGVNATVPLRFGSFTSEKNLKVANTALETYIQQFSCNECHAGAKIAGSKTLASDFSFLFGMAGSSSPTFPIQVIEKDGARQ